MPVVLAEKIDLRNIESLAFYARIVLLVSIDGPFFRSLDKIQWFFVEQRKLGSYELQRLYYI